MAIATLFASNTFIIFAHCCRVTLVLASLSLLGERLNPFFAFLYQGKLLPAWRWKICSAKGFVVTLALTGLFDCLDGD